MFPVQALDGVGVGLRSVAVPGLVPRTLSDTGRVNVGQGAVGPEGAGGRAGAGGLLAVVFNFANNLLAGLIASATIAQAHSPRKVIDLLLIGVNVGPNLSITGSLATIRSLTAIRREGESVEFWRFLNLGVFVTPLALILAIGGLLLLA